MKPRQLKQPISTRKLTTRESIIILEASKLHGYLFPPWSDRENLSIPEESSPFVDDFQFTLSKVQSDDFGSWTSVPHILRDIKPHIALQPTSETTLDLVQDLTTDCSVVASLCAITARTEKGFNDLCESIFHGWRSGAEPHDLPHRSRYLVCLSFNGTSRKVIIDDRLPISNSGRRLFVSNRNDPTIMWPALLEKAYLKVRGGYDFPGSNSGTDLSVLTGWIPEQIFLQSEDLDRDALWQRLAAAFGYGDVLVTIGTGRTSSEEENGSGLATQHDYAIVDMRSVVDEKSFLVKNPWSVSSGTDSLAWELQHDRSEIVPQSSRRQGSHAGLFWMSFDQIFQHFESLYLNWNPGLFGFRQDAHFSWDMTGPQSPDGCFRRNPQYVIQCSGGGLLWLSLTRHFISRDASPRTIIDRSFFGPTEDGFISMYAFEGDHRVYSSNHAVKNSPYVDSPNTLLKLDLPEKSSIAIALSQQALPSFKHHFTISCFSLHQAELRVAPDQHPYKCNRQGTWSKLTAGGNSNSHSYYRNPQYHVTLGATSDLCLMLETPSNGIPIHIALLWAKGHRVRTITARDIVGDSGEYSKGFALAELSQIAQGSYTAVCSTFDANQLADYELHIASSSPCEVAKIPALGAGYHEAQVQPAFFRPATTCLKLPISTERFNRLLVSIWPPSHGARSDHRATVPLRVSVLAGRGDMVQTLAMSGDGDFVELTPAGIVLEDVDLQPETCYRSGVYLMIERLTTSGLNMDELMHVSIQSEVPLIVGAWVDG